MQMNNVIWRLNQHHVRIYANEQCNMEIISVSCENICK